MDGLSQDFRYAYRGLYRNPGLAVVVVLIPGLGIGINTAVFSVIESVLLRPLPFYHPDRLTTCSQISHETDKGWRKSD